MRSVIIAVLCSLLWMSAAWGADGILVRWTEPDADHTEQVAGLSRRLAVSLTLVRPLGPDTALIAPSAHLSVDELAALVDRVHSDDAVAEAQADQRRRLRLVPNDPAFAAQWYLFESVGIQAPDAWDLERGSSAVTIAVIDSGIVPHVDIDPARVMPGYDFISDLSIANDGDGRDADPSDPGDAVVADECGPGSPAQDSSWHGLTVSGVIMATADNNIGVAGIDHGANLLPVRAFGKCGALVSDIIDAIRWAAGLAVSGAPTNAHPADVLNLSFSGSGLCTSFEQSAINDARAAGAAVVVAAGNGDGVLGAGAGDVAFETPANCDGVITATAVDRAGVLTSYSKVGEEVAISAAVGDGDGGVVTTANSGLTTPVADVYRGFEGTSYAAAEVSGVIGLILAADPGLTPDEVRALLQATATPFPDASCNDTLCGAGLLNAAAAVAMAPGYVAPVTGNISSGDSGGGGGCAIGAGDRRELLWLGLLGWVLLRGVRCRHSRHNSL